VKDGNREVRDKVQRLYFSFLMTILHTVLILMLPSYLMNVLPT